MSSASPLSGRATRDRRDCTRESHHVHLVQRTNGDMRGVAPAAGGRSNTSTNALLSARGDARARNSVCPVARTADWRLLRAASSRAIGRRHGESRRWCGHAPRRCWSNSERSPRRSWTRRNPASRPRAGRGNRPQRERSRTGGWRAELRAAAARDRLGPGSRVDVGPWLRSCWRGHASERGRLIRATRLHTLAARTRASYS